MGEALMFGGGRTVLFDPAFEKASWESVIAACQSGRVPSSWKVGDQKLMTINGTDYPIDIIGINHDDYADGSGKAPLTFQLHTVYGTGYNDRPVFDNAGWQEWEYSTLRNTTLPSILAMMPAEVQSTVREVEKITTTRSGLARKTNDKLFVLSEYELMGKNTYAPKADGTWYEYYAIGNPTVKGYNWTTSNMSYWLRNEYKSDAYILISYVNGGISWTNRDGISGLSFAFCF